MIRARRTLASYLALGVATLCGFTAPRAHAQAVATATGPGSYLSVGFAGSGFQQSYGTHYIGGETLFVDANIYRRIGIEAEGRLLNAHTTESIKERTYLIGPKISAFSHNLRPYVKLLVGRGTVYLPFGFGTSSTFVAAPGAGLDWHIAHRLSVRVVDFEYQIWPQFAYPVGNGQIAYGQITPYGISAGLSLDVLTGSSRTRGHHF